MLAPRLPFLLPALLASTSCLVQAHGGHGGSYDEHGADDETLGYAERHMRSEHHIDAFDAESFFHLHDLNHDGILDIEEIEAIYGLHHDSSKAASSSEDTHSAKAKIVVARVLDLLDKDKDGVLTLSEFIEAGSEGLPDFKGFEELGHHYDEESEYFLHHEERFHSTPETQTDEAYNHPEDIAHFQHHEEIEKKEDDRAKVFLEGETPTHADMPHEAPPKDAASHERKVPSVSERLSKDRIAAQNEAKYGEGEKGFKRPRTARDKMRRGTPYKYKFRRSPKEF